MYERYELYNYYKINFHTEYEQIRDVTVHNLSLQDDQVPDI